MRASLTRFLATACFVWAAAIPVACAPEGAGSIHINPKHESKLILSQGRKPPAPPRAKPAVGKKVSHAKITKK
jgi:hypothetical protein